VPPGEYDIYATFYDRTKVDADLITWPRWLSSTTRVEIVDKDVPDIALTIEEGTEIRGRVSFYE
jgi:hypothetical protein